MLHKDTINISINHYILLVAHDKIPYSCEYPMVERLGSYRIKRSFLMMPPAYRQTKKKSLILTDEALSVLFKKKMCLKDFVGPIGFEPMTLCL